METGYFYGAGAGHFNQPITVDESYILGGGAHNYNKEDLTIDEAYVLSLYDNNLSFMSLLNSTATTSSSELVNFPPSLTPTHFHQTMKIEPCHISNLGADDLPHNMYNKRCAETNDELKKMKSGRCEVLRKKRKKISEKNMCLQKLLPWVTKMNTSTMYEEAAKYIKFLEAQIHVLKTMPHYTSSSLSSCSSSSSSSWPYSRSSEKEMEMLMKLDREELLSVMLNSPVVQTVLTRKGWCVYTAEQMDALVNEAVTTGKAPVEVMPSYLDGMIGNYYYYS